MPDELSAEEYEMRRRRKIALENQGKIDRLRGLGEMDRARDASRWVGDDARRR